MNNSGDHIFRSPTKQFQTLNLCPMNPHMNALSHFFYGGEGILMPKENKSIWILYFLT